MVAIGSIPLTIYVRNGSPGDWQIKLRQFYESPGVMPQFHFQIGGRGYAAGRSE